MGEVCCVSSLSFFEGGKGGKRGIGWYSLDGVGASLELCVGARVLVYSAPRI